MLVFTVPMAHFRGIPTYLRERHGIPVVFYDGDVPMSLPEFGGMDTGFNYYHGADPSEYDLVLSNSEGGLERLRELGARRAEAVFWARRPGALPPAAVEKEPDVFFYGYGDKFRREWMAGAGRRAEPARPPRSTSRSAARDFRGDIGARAMIGDVPFNVFARAISAARINLNVTRRAHATVDASSTCRPFELAAAGAAIVSNPHEGIERWFEPGRELLVVDERRRGARPRTASSSTIPAQAEAMGRRARERVLDEHTYAHRARQILLRPASGSSRRCRPARRARASARGDRDRPGAERGGGDRPASIDEIRAFDPGFDIVVVDDGSTDRTAGIAARRRRARRSRLPFNLGIGGAVQTGFRYALERGYDVAVRSTATASTTRRSCRSCSSRLCAARPTSCVGSRFVDGAGGYRPPLTRRLGITAVRAARLAALAASG